MRLLLNIESSTCAENMILLVSQIQENQFEGTIAFIRMKRRTQFGKLRKLNREYSTERIQMESQYFCIVSKRTTPTWLDEHSCMEPTRIIWTIMNAILVQTHPNLDKDPVR